MLTTQKVFAKDFFPPLIECLNAGQNASFRITGLSMWPLLCHRRDSVVLTATDPAELKVGDIVLFQPDPNNYLVHRITKIKGDMMETTGDGNLRRDGWFSKDSVRGRVIIVVRKGKEIRVDQLGWRILFRVWMFLFPVRRWIFAMNRLRHRVAVWRRR